MKDNYRIKVIGKQTIDGETDTIEVITEGDLLIGDGRITVTYPEYSEDNPSVRTDTTVTYENGVLSIERRSEMSSHLMLEEHVRHECLYNTPMGQMFIGIYTDSITCKINEQGGEIRAAYQLDFNTAAASYNELFISIKEK